MSALLPVHAGVQSDHLRAALDGLLGQTRSVDEVVVVHDGQLTAEQLSVLLDLDTRHPHVVHVELPVNRGAGVANQAGLEVATGEWIAKADADDICLPTRVERQLHAVAATGADVCGAAMHEFDHDPTRPVSRRGGPVHHREIARRMKWNNPVNHPTVLYRRDLALAAGGYPEWRYMQDYGLMARMLSRGARMANLDQPLVLFRSGGDVTRRRRSREIRRLEPVVQRELRELGVIGSARAVWNTLWRTGFRLLPTTAVSLVSRRVLARAIPAGRRAR